MPALHLILQNFCVFSNAIQQNTKFKEGWQSLLRILDVLTVFNIEHGGLYFEYNQETLQIQKRYLLTNKYVRMHFNNVPW